MSASGIIALKPIKGSELIKQHADTPKEVPVSRYTPPSKRGEEVKVVSLTAEQLDSQTNFPSLPSTGSMTKAASWGQLRARLSSPPMTPRPDATPVVDEPPTENSMKMVIEESLKRNEAEAEQAQKNEAITDPFLMSREKAQRDGWEVLKLNMRGQEKRAWFTKSSYAFQEQVEQPCSWPAPIMSFSVDKVQKLIHHS
jgi:hypothetical protein